MSMPLRGFYPLGVAAKWLFVAMLAPLGWPGLARASGELDFAHGLYRQGRYRLAAEEYARIAGAEPASLAALEARFFLAECKLQLRQEDEALALFEELARWEKPEPPHRRTALFRAGQLRHRRQDWAGAIEFLTTFVDAYPTDDLGGNAWCVLAESQLALGKLDEAEKSFERADDSKPAPALAATIAFGKARLAERMGKFDQAKERYRAIAANDQGEYADDARLELGVLAFQQDRFEEAAQEFRGLVAGFPDSPLLPAALLNLGMAQMRLGQYPEALATFRSASERFADHALAADFGYQAGLCELYAGQSQAALASLTAWAQGHPTDSRLPRAWYYVARAAFEAKETAGIRDSYHRLGELPDGSEWRDRTGALLAQALAREPAAGDRDALFETLARETNDPPSLERVRYHVAEAWIGEKKYAEAAKLLAAILESEPSAELAPDARYLLGVCLAKEKRWSEAARQLEGYLFPDGAGRVESAERGATRDAALRYLGEALANLPPADVPAEREGRLVEFVLAGPQPDALLRSLAEQRLAVGKTDEAAKIVDRARGAPGVGNESKVALLTRLGWACFEAKRHAAARDRFRAAAELAKDQPAALAEARWMSGVTAEELGDKQAALAEFEAAFREAPGSGHDVDAGRRAAELRIEAGQGEEADGIYAELARRLADSPRLEEVLADRAWLALERDDKGSAAKWFEELVTRFPRGALVAEARVKLAELAYERGEFDLADRQAQAALEANPDPSLVPTILYRRGLAAQRAGRDEDARQALERLTREFASDPMAAGLAAAALFRLAEMAWDAGDTDAALERYRELLGRPEGAKFAPTARLRIAQGHLDKREWSLAQAAAAALVEEKDARIAREALFVEGRALAQQAKFDLARARYEQAAGAEKDELAAKARFMIGETHFHQRQFEQALKDFLKVEILFPIQPWRAMALFEVGKCHEQLGEKAEAIAAYRKLVESFPDEAAAKSAQARLEALAR